MTMRGGGVAKNAMWKLFSLCSDAGSSRLSLSPLPPLWHGIRFFNHQRESQQKELMAFVEKARRISNVQEARELYLKVRTSSVSRKRYLQNTLIQMFGRCKSPIEARAVFDEVYYKDIHTYNMMFQALAENSEGSEQEALHIFRQMQAEKEVKPTELTFMRLLQMQAENLSFYRAIQASIFKNAEVKFSINLITKLIAVFTRFRAVEEAERIFQDASEKPVKMYNAMLQCYLHNSRHADVVNLFDELEKQGKLPDERTYAQAVVACGHLGWLSKGQQIHKLMIERRCIDGHGAAALVSMYGHCGELEAATTVFQRFASPDLPLWNAMIAALAMNGEVKDAFEHVTQLRARGFSPNEVTFGALLPMCSTFGLLDEAKGCVRAMKETGVLINRHHHCSIVHLLGRLSKFEAAEKHIKNMTVQPDAAVWVALLSACRGLFYSGNAPQDCLEVAERAAAAAIKLCPDNAPAYLLMADIYETVGDWEASKHWTQLMEECGIRKEPAKSHIEIAGGKMRVFEAGTVPDDVEIDPDDGPSAKHSEQIAIAFGLQKTHAAETLRLTCNHLMCKACHAKMKQLSSNQGRIIVVRDADLVHTFKTGTCSCNDAKY